jgi:ribonuclease HIII
MPNFKTKLTPSQRKPIEIKLNALQATYLWKLMPEQYCVFRMDGKVAGGWIRVKQYTNGTLFIDAESPQGLSQLLQHIGLEPQVDKDESISDSTSLMPGLLYPYTGSDESGKGDYFGPLVVAGVNLVDVDTGNQLKKLGIADSKTLKDQRITRTGQHSG